MITLELPEPPALNVMIDLAIRAARQERSYLREQVADRQPPGGG